MKLFLTLLFCAISLLVIGQNFPKEMRLSADGNRLQLGGHATTGFYNESQIRQIELEFPTDNFWSNLTAAEDTDVMASVMIDGVFFDSVGVRFKGATSDFRNDSEKKSFNISMDAFIEGQDVRGYETLNLNGNFDDPSSIREIAFNHVGRNYIPALKTNMAELYINGTYWGPYLNVQQLNGEFIREWFLSNDGTRWRAEQEGTGAGPGGGGGGQGGGGGPRFGQGMSTLNFLGPETAYIPNYDLKNTSKENPWTDLAMGTEKLNTLPTDNMLYDELKNYVDIDKALWFLAHEIIFTDSDGYINKGGSDYYVYWEAETGRLVPLEYDGNSVLLLNRDGVWTPFYREDEVDFPLANRLWASPDLRQRYLAHFRVILEEFFTPDYMNALIDGYANQIRGLIEKDTKRLSEPAEFEAEILAIKEFINQRRNTLMAHPEVQATGATISEVNASTTTPSSGESVTITATIAGDRAASTVKLYYGQGTVGTFDRVEMRSTGAGTYEGTIPNFPAGEYVRYYIEALADDAVQTATYSPKGAEHDVYVYRVNVGEANQTDVVINEFMASNDLFIADQDGEFDDWIELFNTTDQDIDLTGYFLSDNAENLDKYDIPDGTIIPANGYLIVWADEDGMQEGLHANFKISAAGEELFLVNPDTIVIDEITFGQQRTDTAFARIPNGIGPFTFAEATFGSENMGTTSLNEVDFNSAKLIVQPNPARESVLIQLNDPQASDMQIRVFDVVGRPVWQQAVSNTSLSLNLSAYEAGIYFLVVNDRVGKRLVVID